MARPLIVAVMSLNSKCGNAPPHQEKVMSFSHDLSNNYCSRCGINLAPSMQFCPQCATPVQYSQQNLPQGSASVQTKRVGLLLGIGILIMPYIFSWFTLRKGYSPRTRVVAFGWLAIIFLPAFSNVLFHMVLNASKKTECVLSIEQSPVLRGLKLGMSMDQVQKQFPRMIIKPPNEFGLTQLLLENKTVTKIGDIGSMHLSLKEDYSVDPALYPAFKDIYGVQVDILDGRVTSIDVLYPKKELSLDDFRKRVKETYNLSDSFLKNGSVACDGFEISTEYLSYSFNPGITPNSSWYNVSDNVGFILRFSETKTRDVLKRRETQKARQEEEAERKKREGKVNGFKP